MSPLTPAESVRQHYRRLAGHAARGWHEHTVRAYRFKAAGRFDLASAAESDGARAERIYRRACQGAAQAGRLVRGTA